MSWARILIVDDQEANVRLLEHILEKGGYERVVGITDPREFDAQVSALNPDIILLDLLMPHIDGFEILERFGPRLKAEYLPVLVLTADTLPETRDRALSSGAKDFLTKPLDPAEVLLRIGNLLETRALHLHLRAENQVLETQVLERAEELDESIAMLRRAESARRALLAQLAVAEEEERKRLSADIHDDPVQKMTAAALRIAALRRRLDDPDMVAEAGDVEHVVEDAVSRLRLLMFELRPPALDTDGLVAAVRELAGHMRGAANGDELEVSIEGHLGVEPPAELAAVLYRVILEAVQNARKHARASTVIVTIEEADGGFRAQVADDGLGFNLGEVDTGGVTHLGLASMRERTEVAGGRLRIRSAPGEGTVVEAWVPIGESA